MDPYVTLKYTKPVSDGKLKLHDGILLSTCVFITLYLMAVRVLP